ncbi:type IV toxin-antitoxin system AbiEi family antitoxin domain-containing protein [Modestobacter versicolor]|uniref:type IV toxin-antitoxin system AbiEi family antitoxin domain-containing protein n=1 Tax=Modestobacter versicolor TaxID=429133 RepID=UPI0034DFF6A3
MHPVLRAAADRQWGVFSASDVRRAGLQPTDVQSALRRGEWDRIRRGVYVERGALADASRRGGNARHRLDCAAVLLCLGGHPAISHASAARLAGLPLPTAERGALVTLTDTEQWRRGRGYAVLRAGLAAHHVRDDGPFSLTGTARTLIDCARGWSLEDAVIAMDAALHAGAVTPEELRATVLEQTHWHGIGTAARAAGLADGRAESPLETLGRLRILGSGLPLPELQVDLHGPRGFVARVDAWYADAAVVVEFDGRVKYDDPFGGRTAAQVLWDEKRREDEIRDLGGRVLRVVPADVGASWPVKADRLRSLLATRPPVPPQLRAVPSARSRRWAG